MASLLTPMAMQLQTPNLGIVECLMRIAAGLLLTALAVGGHVGPWGFVGLAILVTGAAWFCPVYKLLGVSSAQRFQQPTLRPTAVAACPRQRP